jgi:hypothetical protein
VFSLRRRLCVNSKKELPNWDYSLAEYYYFLCVPLSSFAAQKKYEWKMNVRRADSLGGEHVLILSAGTFNGSESRFAATLLTLIAKMENFPPAAGIPTGVCLISLLTLMPAEN